jgi:hypothetical protein
MPNEKELIYINKQFEEFFSENNFKLEQNQIGQIEFGNDCAQLIFFYEIQYSTPTFDSIYYKNKKSGEKYFIGNIIEFFNKDLKFNSLMESYTGKINDLKMTDVKAYSLIIPKYLGDLIKSCDFSWEEKLKEELKKNSKW